jgi:hypothetical protein
LVLNWSFYCSRRRRGPPHTGPCRRACGAARSAPAAAPARVLGSGFRASDFGLLVQDLGSRVSGFGFRVFRFWISDSGFWVSNLGCWVSDFVSQMLGFEFRYGSGVGHARRPPPVPRAQASSFAFRFLSRIWGLGFWGHSLCFSLPTKTKVESGMSQTKMELLLT